MPVSVTFALYTYLFVFYTYVSFMLCLKFQFYLYPTILMDYTKISFDMLWEDEALAQKHASRALIYGALFFWFAGNLIVSIIRTIATNPGNIPEEKEWDMSTEADDKTDNEQNDQRETAVTSTPE